MPGSPSSQIQAIESTRVWPWVFHGWLLALVMLIAAATGLGRIYEDEDGRPVKTLKKQDLVDEVIFEGRS